MSVQENLLEISKSLENLEETGIYDVEKYSCSLKHLTNQLEYFYCHLVKEGDRILIIHIIILQVGQWYIN
ncbi:hypothetical protein SD457_11930 [Coprobacillaceae bacterium CR2/5/TPMF4]|nr:hypothetical protein SD457_11930 [Coprobacillaceae bacterium CR2/5/TPMF4]